MKKNPEGSSRLFSGGTYSPEAVKLAAAVFSDRMPVSFSRSGSGTLVRFPAGAGLEGEFSNEVLNQQCRIDLSAVNARLSGMIVTKALLSASGETAKKRGSK